MGMIGALALLALLAAPAAGAEPVAESPACKPIRLGADAAVVLAALDTPDGRCATWVGSGHQLSTDFPVAGVVAAPVFAALMMIPRRGDEPLLNTALLRADAEVIEALLDAGADPSAVPGERSAWAAAIERARRVRSMFVGVEVLVRRGVPLPALSQDDAYTLAARPDLLLPLCRDGLVFLPGPEPAVMQATSDEQLVEPTALLDCGLPVDEVADHWTALGHAAAANQPGAAALLLERGADPNGGPGRHDLDPLHTAGFLGHPEVGELLVAAGAKGVPRYRRLLRQRARKLAAWSTR